MNVSPISTARLTLRPLETADAVTLHRIYQTDGVVRYFPNPNPPPMEKLERFIAGQQEHWEKYSYGNWGIQVRSVMRNDIPQTDDLAGFHPAPQSTSLRSNQCQEIIGWAGLQFLPELNETEVGFLLDKPFWGKGYATEAARASLQFGFDNFDLDHIIALVHPQNAASLRVIQKCGMTIDRTILLWGIELVHHHVDRIGN